MIVKNPTPNDLEVRIDGIDYVAPANGEVSNVLPEHAEYWQKRIHQFVEVYAEKTAKAPTVTATGEDPKSAVVIPAPKVVVKAPPKKK